MARTSTEIQKRSDEKRGVAAKSYKLPKETIELIAEISEQTSICRDCRSRAPLRKQ